jgi:hypothetical protein
MTESEHLSLDQVRAYVRGALHPSTLVSTDDHLEACASCRAVLARESDASFGAEAFGRALATPDARPESPHLTFDHLRGAVDGGLSPVDQEWVEAHVALCVMCAEELRDLERFASTLPDRPAPPVPAAAAPVPPALTPPGGDASALRPRPRVRPADDAADPPARYGQTPPTRLPLWIKVAVGASLAAILQLWAC